VGYPVLRAQVKYEAQDIPQFVLKGLMEVSKIQPAVPCGYKEFWPIL